ncbi:hypothetical protein DFH06DRAFT_1123397 [Mycena polygramma]|nr:hypothetical protein DFH06DRAFT_1123397 [Mycena polygramma]
MIRNRYENSPTTFNSITGSWEVQEPSDPPPVLPKRVARPPHTECAKCCATTTWDRWYGRICESWYPAPGGAVRITDGVKYSQVRESQRATKNRIGISSTLITPDVASPALPFQLGSSVRLRLSCRIDPDRFPRINPGLPVRSWFVLMLMLQIALVPTVSPAEIVQQGTVDKTVWKPPQSKSAAFPTNLNEVFSPVPFHSASCVALTNLPAANN